MTPPIAFLAAALLLVTALGAQAQTAKWDQAAVTAAAAEFESAIAGLREAIRKSQAWTMTAQRSKLYEIRQELRQMEHLATTLHADLKNGEGIEETTPGYEQILARREHVRTDAMFVDVDEFVKPKVEASRSALKKLSAFYVKQPSD